MTANGKSFRSHKEQFPEAYPSDDPAEAALLAATVAEINDGLDKPCPWGTCVLRSGHASEHAPYVYVDPRDAIIADLQASLARIEALVARIERADSGNGIEILARDGR